jgi:hypothetical protein
VVRGTIVDMEIDAMRIGAMRMILGIRRGNDELILDSRFRGNGSVRAVVTPLLRLSHRSAVRSPT